MPWPRHLAAAAAIALLFTGVASGAYVVRRWQAIPTVELIERTPAQTREVRKSVDKVAPVLSAGDLGDRVDEPAPVRRASPRKRSVLVAKTAEIAPADLLQNANALRAQSRWRDAERVYRQVAALTPGSDDAYAAAVAAASLRLDHLGDAAGALPLYRGVLRSHPTGALAEEVRWGIAEAYHALGHSDLEADALRAFLAAHPQSLLKAAAQARLSMATAASTSAAPSP
ncbi:MAG: tetratricopeptide repeat protein [Deltaproteobacteria bacterium]|nr:tetratricopeptide repeat protein [Deltaproteobacteria bacterium]